MTRVFDKVYVGGGGEEEGQKRLSAPEGGHRRCGKPLRVCLDSEKANFRIRMHTIEQFPPIPVSFRILRTKDIQAQASFDMQLK